MEYGYIYKITNLINGRIYIGQHKGTFTPKYLGSGIVIERAIKKHGRENFRLEVLAFATTKEMLSGLEKKFIYEYREVFGNEFLYNLANGGQGGIHSEEHQKKLNLSHTGKRQSDEVQRKRGRKISSALKGRVALNKGKPMSEEQKNKLRGLVRSEEHRKNLSISLKGRTVWNKTDSNIECEGCGKIIHRKPFIIKRAKHHYCSKECRFSKNDTQATGSNIVPPLIGAQNRLQEKAVKVS
jgi:hypothetical protein